MKKKILIIVGIILLFIVSLTIYKSYISNKNQQNIKFRVDVEQDAQVKSNEMMLSKSLTDIVNSQALSDEKKDEKSKNYTNLKNHNDE